MAGMHFEPAPCWGRRGAESCTACTLLQMPADYRGPFPGLALKLPAVQSIGTDAEFCRNRRSAGAVIPGPSVGAEQHGVGAVAHAVSVLPLVPAGHPCRLGAPEMGAACAAVQTN